MEERGWFLFRQADGKGPHVYGFGTEAEAREFAEINEVDFKPGEPDDLCEEIDLADPCGE